MGKKEFKKDIQTKESRIINNKNNSVIDSLDIDAKKEDSQTQEKDQYLKGVRIKDNRKDTLQFSEKETVKNNKNSESVDIDEPEPRTNRFQFLSADMLKILAMFFMLVDHTWISVVDGNNWMNYIGRLAFPIFAFQVVEGFFHTSDLKKYKKRLLIFALLTEIPFNFFISGYVLYPLHQNVLFTFLLGVIVMELLEKHFKFPTTTSIIYTTFLILLILFVTMFGFFDYSYLGIFTILTFYISQKIGLIKKIRFLRYPIMILGIVYFHIFAAYGQLIEIPFFGGIVNFPVQGFAALSLIPILLYNGEKGAGWNIVSKVGYLFYPLHLIVLYFISLLF